MAQLTIDALEKRLKEARKQRRASKRALFLEAFCKDVMLFSKTRCAPSRTYLQMQRSTALASNIEKTLEARKKTMQIYQDYKKGLQTRNLAQFSYLRYLYFRERLINHR